MASTSSTSSTASSPYRRAGSIHDDSDRDHGVGRSGGEPSSSTAGSSRHILRRNQACQPCRKKKLKCDAQRPHCTNCIKSWKNLLAIPAPEGYQHPTSPPCSYDTLEASDQFDPAKRIKELEMEISNLKSKLHEAQSSARSSCSSESSGSSRHSHSPTPTEPPITQSNGMALHKASLTITNSLCRTGGAPIPEFKRKVRPEKVEELVDSGWNMHLPEPDIMKELVKLYFDNDPCGSRMLHRPTLLANINLPPKHPRFPHPALLHAICASAARWAPPDLRIAEDYQNGLFAKYHALMTRHYIHAEMEQRKDIFSVLQAMVIVCWYFYSEARWVEVWIWSGFQTRVIVPLRLNFPGTFAGEEWLRPKDHNDLEMRRRLFWMMIVFDRVVSAGGAPVHAIDEGDIATELPLRMKDYHGHLLPDPPQSIHSPEVFLHHPTGYTDAFILLIKAVMLYGKVTDFNFRSRLRLRSAGSSTNGSAGNSPASSGTSSMSGSDPNPTPTSNPNSNPNNNNSSSTYYGNTYSQQNYTPLFDFHYLDQLLSHDFLASLPPEYQDYLGVADGGVGKVKVDTDLFLVHNIPHAATITLHGDYMVLDDPMGILTPSTERCLTAARHILNAYHAVSAPNLDFDITRLHPFTIHCWYLAATVQVKLCQYYIRLGDTSNEALVWRDLYHLKWAIGRYGRWSPIGDRQCELLTTLLMNLAAETKLNEAERGLHEVIAVRKVAYQTHFHANLWNPAHWREEGPDGWEWPDAPSYGNNNNFDQSMAGSTSTGDFTASGELGGFDGFVGSSSAVGAEGIYTGTEGDNFWNL